MPRSAYSDLRQEPCTSARSKTAHLLTTQYAHFTSSLIRQLTAVNQQSTRSPAKILPMYALEAMDETCSFLSLVLVCRPQHLRGLLVFCCWRKPLCFVNVCYRYLERSASRWRNLWSHDYLLSHIFDLIHSTLCVHRNLCQLYKHTHCFHKQARQTYAEPDLNTSMSQAWLTLGICCFSRNANSHAHLTERSKPLCAPIHLH